MTDISYVVRKTGSRQWRCDTEVSGTVVASTVWPSHRLAIQAARAIAAEATRRADAEVANIFHRELSA